MADLVITSMRGGQNEDTPTAIADDQCAEARNVEFWRSQLGERRNGSDGIDLTGSPLAACDRVVWDHRHQPGDAADAQYWGLGITGSTAVLAYKDTTWHTVTMPDAMVIDGVSEYQVQGLTLQDKLFIAYNSAVDRLHVFVAGASALRRTGLAQPAAAPLAANGGGAGALSGERSYRIRFIEWSGVVDEAPTRRSEPSDSVTIVPDAAHANVTVTRPAVISEGETHWELEGTLNGNDYYIVATTAIGTATAVDTVAFSTGYVTTGLDLSEDIGDYTLIPSVRLLTADEDRLLGGGDYEDISLESRVVWTPVYGDEGVGNDERLMLKTDPFKDLNSSESGGLTGLSQAVLGYVYATKLSHTYQLSRSGTRTKAYDDVPLTKERGALPGSLVAALDLTGNPSLFMLDPDIGPCRIGPRGVEPCGADLRVTWDTVNLDATKVVSRSIYFREKKQVHWWVATGTANVPNLRLMLQTNEMRETPDGLRRGWSVFDGPSAAALTVCMFADNIDAGTDRSGVLKPVIGVEGNGLIWMTDTGDDDNGTDYSAYVVSKAYVRRALLHQFKCNSGVLLAKATENATMKVTVIGNFGLTEKSSDDVDCSPEESEDYVLRKLSDLGLAELFAVQVRIEDTDIPGAQWAAELFALRDESAQGAN